jgi:hypothetical protein
MTGLTMTKQTIAGHRISARLMTLFAMVLTVSLGGLEARAESAATYMQRVQNELMGAQRSGSVSAFAGVLRKRWDRTPPPCRARIVRPTSTA